MSWLGSLIGGIFDTRNSRANRKAQEKENERQREHARQQQEDAQLFNAEQAQLDRVFQSSEAQVNRDFQSKMAEEAYNREVEFYEQYQSIGAQMRQYKDAGLNPALLAGGVSPASSAPSSASPSGSTPSGSSASSGVSVAGVSSLPGVIGIAEKVLDLQAMKESINGMKEDIRLKRAQAIGQEINNLTAGDLNSASIANLWAKTRESEENRNLLVQKVLSESVSREQMQHNISLLVQKAFTEESTRKLQGQQIGLIASQVASIDANVLISQQLADNNTRLTDAQVSELNKNASLISERISSVVVERDFFNRVSEYRVNLEKARSDNASVAEKLHALSPIIGKIDFPHQFEGTFDDKNKMYDRAWRNYLDTYIDIMISVAESK